MIVEDYKILFALLMAVGEVPEVNMLLAGVERRSGHAEAVVGRGSDGQVRDLVIVSCGGVKDCVFAAGGHGNDVHGREQV